MTIIRNAYPKNIEDKDKTIFDIASIYHIKEAKVETFKNCLWNVLLQKRINSLGLQIKAVLSLLLFRKGFIYSNKAGWVLDSYSKNYFHWFNDVLPRILHLKAEFPDHEILLDNASLKLKFINESITQLGISYRAIPNHAILFCKELLFPSVGTSGIQDPYLFTRLQKLFSTGFDPRKRTRKILYPANNRDPGKSSIIMKFKTLWQISDLI